MFTVNNTQGVETTGEDPEPILDGESPQGTTIDYLVVARDAIVVSN